MPHVHSGAIHVATIGLSAVVFFGLLNLIAMRFAGHPAADAWLDMFGHGA